jgi:PAS domain S-box-containing protein
MPPIQSLRKKQFTSRDIDAVLGQLSAPALLWKASADKFLACNSKFIHLSRYSRIDLSTLTMTGLFSDIQTSIGLSNSTIYTNFLTQSNASIPVRLTITDIDTNENLKLILIEDTRTEVDEKDNLAGGELPWKKLSALVNILLEVEHIDRELGYFLRISQSLLGTDFAAVYKPVPGLEDALGLVASTGAIDFLPDILKLGDIGHLEIPIIWQIGEPPLTALHQNALAGQVSFLSTAPLVPHDARKGILVVGGISTKIPKLHISKIETVTTLLKVFEQLQGGKFSGDGVFGSGQQSTIEAVQQLKDQISDGILFIDENRNVVDINISACDKLGFFKMEVLFQPVEKILVSDWGISQLLDSTRSKEPTTHNLGEMEFQRRDGSPLPVNVRLISMPEGSTDPSAILFSDLSVEKEYENRSRQLETQANLGEMMAVFAHEVRNPINNIRMGIENFGQYAVNDPEFCEEIDRLLVDVDRISDLMKTILSAYRTKEYTMESFNLSGLLETITFRWASRMKRHKIELNSEIPRSILITGDRNALEQVFTNIIQNAINAMEEKGGRLSIRLTEDAITKGVAIDIADNGPGIPQEIHDKIFNLYFTTKDTGNGIGLAFAKQIVDAHNGRISVASVPGGTVFRVTLPKNT